MLVGYARISTADQSSLAELYNPLATPGPLVQAHQKLDRAVDRLFVGRRALGSDSDRLSILFERYVEMTRVRGAK